MHAESKRRRWSDSQRIGILDETERTYWTKFFGVEAEDLMRAVDKVGTSAEKVRQYLHVERTLDWVVDGGRTERRRESPTQRYFQ